jgi:hypothetical protein
MKTETEKRNRGRPATGRNNKMVSMRLPFDTITEMNRLSKIERFKNKTNVIVTAIQNLSEKFPKKM